MNITVQLAVVVAVCLCIAEGATEVRMTRKQQRPTRGFKNVEMMTARGFGKRTEHKLMKFRPNVPLMAAIGFGKRSGNDEVKKEDKLLRFRPSVPLMTALDFGKRSGSDELSEEEEEIRVTRGTFKPNSNVLIARGYGKRQEAVKNGEDEIRVIRGSFKPNSKILIARDYGKRQEATNEAYGLDNFWENLEASQEKDAQEANEEKPLESIPLDWFVNEMVNNPEFARSVVRKFIDLNQDSMLSSDELLRNV